MTRNDRIRRRRPWQRVQPRVVLSAAALAVPLLAGSMAAQAPAAMAATAPSAAGTAATPQALASAYAAGRHVPAGAIGELRAGSLREGRAGGASWATASFTPSAKASTLLKDGFQDGAGTGVFVQSGSSPWHLVHTGPYGCGRGLPAALQRSWHLAQAATCQVTAAQERATAARSAATTPAGTSLRQRIADIALGQIGVSTNPTVSGFSGVDCDPFTSLVAGFSANDDGCGPNAGFGVQNGNETWCSDFAKWVWQQAGVTAGMNTLNAGSVSFYDWGLQQGETLAPDTGTPQPGDAIVFFPPGTIKPTSFADHIGLVTSVNADGTINMANGDFAGGGEVSVQYDTNIDLTTWPSTIWNNGEQWVIVTPPASAQQPAPDAQMTGPHAAVTGTVTHFSAAATEPGGSISQYFWTFGDGRSTNTTGTQVSHVFGEDGMYTVTVTVTSSFGTITTKTWNVHVLGASSPVASAASDAVWFSNVPTSQWMFVRSGASGLAADTSDGLSWLQFPIPGQLSERAGLTALSYPDPAADYAMTPHAYYRSAAGTLAQTYQGTAGWVTQQLAGQPADGSAIVAASTPAGPEVFYFTADGRLAESAQHGNSWVTSAVSGPPTTDPGELAIADAASGPVLFYRVGHVLFANPPSGAPVPVATHASAGSPLAAVTAPSGQPTAVFTDQAGNLATATPGGAVTELPGSPAGTSLAATNYLLPGSATSLGTEVFYLTAGGQPAVSYDDGSGWQAASLPAGTATALTAANAYQVAGQPTEVFAQTASGPAEYTAAGPAGPWSAQPLPTAPATFDDQVLLYAATPDDAASAQAAAAAAGLPASQVTESYNVAWDATLSGNYLVIAVGLPATDGLFYNACGWANPSADDAGTPFSRATNPPLNTLPPLDDFEEAAAATASLTPAFAVDVAYYATHGTLPPGVTALPARALITRVCAGTPG